jgi:hypothetical protein
MTRSPRLRLRLAALTLTFALPAVYAATTLGASARQNAPSSIVPPLLAYVGGSDNPAVYVAGINGAHPRRLGAGDQPLLSPVGTYVAAGTQTATGAALKLYSTTQGPARSFFNVKQSEAVPVAWSSDGEYLAIDLIGTAVTGDKGSGLAILDTQTMKTKLVANGEIFGASFAPDSAGDELVYGSAPSLNESAKVNLHTVNADGTGAKQITSDGRSLDPIWGLKGIVFDRQTMRGKDTAPLYQLWLKNGTHLTQVTHLKVPLLLDGLVPVSVSRDGSRLLAGYIGEDTDEAWTVQLSTGKAREVTVPHQYVQGTAISSDGKSLLIEVGAFENSPSHGTVEKIPFGGGAVVKLIHGGAEGSWDL